MKPSSSELLRRPLPSRPRPPCETGANGLPPSRRPGVPEKESKWSPLKMISEKISAWLRNRQAMCEWSQFSDHELRHIRVRRSEIEDVARRQGRRRANT